MTCNFAHLLMIEVDRYTHTQLLDTNRNICKYEWILISLTSLLNWAFWNNVYEILWFFSLSKGLDEPLDESACRYESFIPSKNSQNFSTSCKDRIETNNCVKYLIDSAESIHFLWEVLNCSASIELHKLLYSNENFNVELP